MIGSKDRYMSTLLTNDELIKTSTLAKLHAAQELDNLGNLNPFSNTQLLTNNSGLSLGMQTEVSRNTKGGSKQHQRISSAFV